MTTYAVRLSSKPSRTFRCAKAANSLDIDTEKKLTHELTIDIDLEKPFNVGLVVGSSGSGKTTLAKEVFGDEVFAELLRMETPVLDQFPEEMEYEDCQRLLNGVGLSQVPCWIRPASTLSNGQRARAEIALQMARPDEMIAIDEWTSVVDRTVAKAMSHCIQKFARRADRRVVLCSCHYDIIEWLQPDWIIDCNKQTFRRCLRRSERKEKLHFEIAELHDRRSWRNFARYHYLSDQLPGGHIALFGLFHQGEQIGFQCFANYVPYRSSHRAAGEQMKMHSNRTVIHPDYVGFGMGITLINITSAIMTGQGYDVWAKYTSIPVHKAMKRFDSLWKLKAVSRPLKQQKGPRMLRDTGFRTKVRVFSYQWTGGANVAAVAKIIAAVRAS